MTRVLNVWWAGRLVGELTQDQGGDLGFAYGVAWLGEESAPAISASLPKRSDPFSRRECRPFFGGLLPEEGQREAAAKVLGISSANDFAMLDRLGGDVAGALQFLRRGEPPQSLEGPWEPTALDDQAILRLLDTLPTRPLLAGEDGPRLSLAGAQTKVPVVLVGGSVALPRSGQPTTHILKPAIPRFEATTENEAFSMRLAAAVGLDVARVDPRAVRAPEGRARTFLLVERYDRASTPTQGMRRLHQEDFCQALGIPVERKYQTEGGPSLEECFALLRRLATRPAVDVLKMLDGVVFNAVIGNADAHGKNFSILYGGDGLCLAPLYDLLSTVIYPELSPKFAMKIGQRSRLEELDALSWSEFAKKAELGVPFVRRRVGDLTELISEKVPATLEELATSGLYNQALEDLSQFIQERVKVCLAGLTRR